MTQVLFVGCFYPPRLLATVVADSKGYVGFSNHNFEMSLLQGLAAQPDADLRVVTAPLVYSYPYHNAKAITHAEEFEVCGAPAVSAGFTNLPLANKLAMTLATARKIAAQLRQFPGPEVEVVVNTPFLPLEGALALARRLSGKKIKTTLIVPDIPQFMSQLDKNGGLKSRAMDQVNSLTMRLAARFDRLVLLTKAMAEFFPAGKPHIVMEGIAPDMPAPAPQPTPAQGEALLYTGSLKREFGVMELLDMFRQAHFPNTQLWICGSGEMAGEIADIARRDSRVRFFGLVDAPTARRLQQEATVLVNPRTAQGEYTKYSFPSKTIEYMLAAKPVVMNRLPGIPPEYDSYLHYPADESSRAWIEAVSAVLATPKAERDTCAQAGRQFILQHKNARAQTARIMQLIGAH